MSPFSASSDLWVLPPPRSSAWFPIIDWYLNWQMSKGLAYSGLHLPGETLRVAGDYEVTLPAVEADSAAPLLVLSLGRVPTAKCVVLDVSGKLETWLKKCFEIALNLDARQVHVFLPAKFSAEEAASLWHARFPERQARFCADSEAKGRAI